MRFIIMHKTIDRWEAGEIPSKEEIRKVGAMIGELQKAGVLLAGEGLRSSSHGVRLKFTGGKRSVTPGPFTGANELPAGFSILSVGSMDEAIEWASQQAEVLGDVEMDIRPVTEPWDIGMVPKPENLSTTRYMVLRKATPDTEAGVVPTGEQRTRLAAQATASGATHMESESLRPSARGRRYKNSRDGVRVTDGPFAESKEMIAGYVIISAESLEEASRWAQHYFNAVETNEVDLRELEDAPAAG